MITVTALNTNFSETPTGEIDMPLSDFIRKNALVRNENGTYSAEWGNGEGSDDFEIVEASTAAPTIWDIMDAKEKELSPMEYSKWLYPDAPLYGAGFEPFDEEAYERDTRNL